MKWVEEILIAKIEGVNDFGVGQGLAQGNEWKVYRKTWPESELFQVGQFVACRVSYAEDNDEYYLQRLKADCCRTEDEWLKQEEKF